MASLLGMTLPRIAGGTARRSFDVLFVFGDSLSDSGNAGRFSDGPVWVEQFALRLGVDLKPSRTGGHNHAVGGARLDGGSGPNSLPAQVDRFLGMPLPSRWMPGRVAEALVDPHHHVEHGRSLTGAATITRLAPRSR